MATSTGELRETLIECIERVKAKRMDPSEAGAVAKLAAQVNTSLQVELNIRMAGIRTDAMGSLHVGEQGEGGAR